MKDDLDIVHTITDYYDGPRGGIADFRGKPHIYKSVWDDSEKGNGDDFLLQPIDEETFRLAMEDWDIWTRWERAFQSGQTTIESHPALPADRQRHEQITTILTTRLQIQPQRAIRVQGHFVVRASSESDDTTARQWAVSWLAHEAAV